MKPITIGWDAPKSPVSHYVVTWFFGSAPIGSVTTFDTETTISLYDPGKYRFEVRVIFDDTASAPAVLDWWVEEFEMYKPEIRDNGIILSWPTVPGRVYEMDVSYDGKTWIPVPGRWLGDGKPAEAGGSPNHDRAEYRVWSKPQ